MIEVFRTDVNEVEHARIMVTEITRQFSDYEVNFDLEDCDRILRVKSSAGIVDASALIQLVRGFGYSAEILPDEEMPAPAVAFPFFNLLNT